MTVKNGTQTQQPPAAVALPADPLADVELVRAPPAALLPPAPDLRERVSPEYRAFFEALVLDVRENGVRLPIVCYREGDALRVSDGWTRALAALMAALKEVPCLAHRVKPPRELELLSQLQANAMRLGMDDFEYAAVYAQFLEGHRWTQADLASRLKVSASLVSKRLRSYASIPEDLRPLFGKGQGKLCGRAAYALARLPDDESKRELARLAADRGLKVEALEALVAQKVGKRPKARAAKGRTPGGLAWAFTGTPEAMLAEVERLGKGLKTLAANKWDLSLLASVLKP